jgi:hypothetical protein
VLGGGGEAVRERKRRGGGAGAWSVAIGGEGKGHERGDGAGAAGEERLGHGEERRRLEVGEAPAGGARLSVSERGEVELAGGACVGQKLSGLRERKRKGEKEAGRRWVGLKGGKGD